MQDILSQSYLLQLEKNEEKLVCPFKLIPTWLKGEEFQEIVKFEWRPFDHKVRALVVE